MIKILFICHGNICRSPMAECVFKDMVKKAGREKEFIIDSHHWLILHGRYCCVARKPKCHECVVADVCNWPDRFEFGADRAIPVKNIEAET